MQWTSFQVANIQLTTMFLCTVLYIS